MMDTAVVAALALPAADVIINILFWKNVYSMIIGADGGIRL